ncbi:hypothetical protein B0I35DRAFT_52774 [Stachybotrys elegans]|uniref:DUF6546 domain-containing protein n=1 Tax=Stachybotrys elegans TaxID=80388 RepID=A0A8K0WNJ1_9HYPO|nr:hypothetical protein B0I35DRAFT_52774 [Stachybotrys elegans]
MLEYWNETWTRDKKYRQCERIRFTEVGARQHYRAKPLAFTLSSTGEGAPVLPQTPIVKRLMLRSMWSRRIGFPSLGKLLRESFVALEWLRYETAGKFLPEHHELIRCGFQNHLLASLPTSLTVLLLNDCRRLQRDTVEKINTTDLAVHSTRRLSRSLAQACRQFSEFSPPWHIDALYFLHNLKAAPQLQRDRCRLQLLSINSAVLRPDLPEEIWVDFFVCAAKAARTLPQLRSIELWHTGRGFGYIFQYTLENGRATIIWSSSGLDIWQFQEVREAWSRVLPTGCPLDVDRGFFTGEIRTDTESVAKRFFWRNLGLPQLCRDPITAAEFEAEALASRQWSQHGTA